VSLWEQCLWISSIVLSVVLIFRMVRNSLHRLYLWFFLYLCAGVVQSLVHLPLDPNSNAYAWAWMLSQPVIWLLYILVVLELYSLVLRKHPGIATLGRWALMGALGVAIVISLVSLLPDLSNQAERYPVLLYFMVIERGLISSLVVFLLLIIAFFLWYPIPLSRNVTLHVGVYAVYFLSSTMALFVRNVTGHELTPAVSTAMIAVANICLLVWILFLNRQGETQTVVLGHQWRPKDEEQLVRQLDAINSALLKAARK
jgi:hypothetical protein